MCHWSENGSMTSKILAEICEKLDSYNIFDRKFVFFTKFWPKILNFDFSSSRSQILNELATCIKGAIDADGFNLYIVSEMHKDFYKYVHPNKMSEEELP